MRDAEEDPPRDAPVRPCKWPSENFMDHAGIKEEFKAYLRNAGLEDFEPHKSEFRDFLASITVGESRDITQATIGSIHFPAIHYFSLFTSRCINAKDEACHMCVPNLSILRSAVLGDQSYHMGAIVARRLHHNRHNGDFFGGIYATRIAH